MRIILKNSVNCGEPLKILYHNVASNGGREGLKTGDIIWEIRSQAAEKSVEGSETRVESKGIELPMAVKTHSGKVIYLSSAGKLVLRKIFKLYELKGSDFLKRLYNKAFKIARSEFSTSSATIALITMLKFNPYNTTTKDRKCIKTWLFHNVGVELKNCDRQGIDPVVYKKQSKSALLRPERKECIIIQEVSDKKQKEKIEKQKNSLSKTLGLLTEDEKEDLKYWNSLGVKKAKSKISQKAKDKSIEKWKKTYWNKPIEERQAIQRKRTTFGKKYHIDNKEIKFDSSWEYNLYMFLRSEDIEFKYNEKGFQISSNQMWYPDFILPKKRMILEVKGHPKAFKRWDNSILPKVEKVTNCEIRLVPFNIDSFDFVSFEDFLTETTLVNNEFVI